jgi:hypothetical protein
MLSLSNGAPLSASIAADQSTLKESEASSEILRIGAIDGAVVLHSNTAHRRPRAGSGRKQSSSSGRQNLVIFASRNFNPGSDLENGRLEMSGRKATQRRTSSCQR